MKTHTLSLFLVFICTLLNALAQILLKLGTKKLSQDFYYLITNYQLILGVFLYMLSAILLIYSLKYGQLSVLYPIISLTYVWVAILSIYWLYEIMTFKQMTGIASIMIGVFFIAKGGFR